MRYFLMFWALALVTTFFVLGWRGRKFDQPPLYLFPDMDVQAKYHPQMDNRFFADQRNDRLPVAGSVARGYAFEASTVFSDDYRYDVAQNPALYSGKNSEGDWYQGFPIPVTRELLELGREKYAIYCTVCHGATGGGNGVLASDGTDYSLDRGYFGNVANLNTKLYIDYPEGQLYDRIANGWNTMYPYRDKLNPTERWAVVAYVRALQLAANGTVADIPPGILKDL